MTLRIKDYHSTTHRAGSAGYDAGRPYRMVAVYEDDTLYLYHMPRPQDREEFKAGLAAALKTSRQLVHSEPTPEI